MTHQRLPALALLAGLVFGTGLVLSDMINAGTVKGFLDFAGLWTGHWQPALAFVMGAAVLVALPLFQWAIKRGRPLLGGSLDTPPSRPDARLLIGAAIFGIGWGLSGICPGPALVWLGMKPLDILPFIAALMAGSALADLIIRYNSRPR